MTENFCEFDTTDGLGCILPAGHTKRTAPKWHLSIAQQDDGVTTPVPDDKGPFMVRVALYKRGKLVHRFEAKQQTSAVEAVQWATQQSLLDAEWADEKYQSEQQ